RGVQQQVKECRAFLFVRLRETLFKLVNEQNRPARPLVAQRNLRPTMEQSRIIGSTLLNFVARIQTFGEGGNDPSEWFEWMTPGCLNLVQPIFAASEGAAFERRDQAR